MGKFDPGGGGGGGGGGVGSGEGGGGGGGRRRSGLFTSSRFTNSKNLAQTFFNPASCRGFFVRCCPYKFCGLCFRTYSSQAAEQCCADTQPGQNFLFGANFFLGPFNTLDFGFSGFVFRFSHNL